MTAAGMIKEMYNVGVRMAVTEEWIASTPYSTADMLYW